MKSPSLKQVLHRWAKAWKRECEAYSGWEYYLDGVERISDSPTGYSERTLMALLTRAWPFGPDSTPGPYLPLIAEFPVIPTPAKRGAKKHKLGGARIPDLWFATRRGESGVLVEGKVVWVDVGGLNRKQDWVNVKTATPNWKWGEPKSLAAVATDQLKKAYGPRDAGAAQGVVALFVNGRVRTDPKTHGQKKPGNWWGAFSSEVTAELKKLAGGTGDQAIACWSHNDWGKLNKDTREWNANEKKHDRRPHNFFYPFGWLLLYRVASVKSK